MALNPKANVLIRDAQGKRLWRQAETGSMQPPPRKARHPGSWKQPEAESDTAEPC